MASSNKEVQAKFKAKRAEEGFKQVNLWVKQEDVEAVKAFVAGLASNEAGVGLCSRKCPFRKA